MATKVPALKNVPVKIDRELRDTLESMREAQEIRLGRRGDPLDRAITLRELIDSGLAKKLTNRPFNPNGLIDFIPNDDTVGDLDIPPAPTSLEASGAFTEIIVSWNGMSASAPYRNHAYTEVWRSRDDELGTAVLITTTSSFIITDPVGYNQTYYYWVRYVSTSDVKGPFNQTNGTKAETVENIAEVMQQLSEELQDLPGYAALNTLITNADVAVAAKAANVIRATSAPTTRTDGSSLQAVDIWVDTNDNNQVYIRNSSNNGWEKARDSSLVSLYNTLSSTVSTNSTNIATAQSDIVTLTTANSSRVSEITELEATLTGFSSSSTVTAAITAEQTARANADSSLATDITNLTATVNSNTSAISTEQTTRANADSALATDITNLTSTVNSNTSAISSEATTRANADSALATDITNLTSTVGGNSSSITTLNTTTANINGDLNAMYVLQVSTESNGSVSAAGMVIGSNANNGSGAQSYVQFQADKFAIWNGSSATAPFIVSGGTVFIDSARIQDGAITNAKILNGTIQEAKIGDAQITTAKIADANITNAKIVDATIQGAKIANAAITNAKINDLSADKINAGFISADRIQANTITAAKINVTDLALEFDAATVSGSALGYWMNNTMRLKKVADIGTDPGVYHIMCRVFGGTSQVKTLSIVAGDGTFGTVGNELRSDFTYNDQPVCTNLSIQDQGYAQYNSSQSQYWSGVDRFQATTHMVQKDFMVRKVSTTSRTLRLYILAQGDTNFAQLSNVQYGFYKFSEI